GTWLPASPDGDLRFVVTTAVGQAAVYRDLQGGSREPSTVTTPDARSQDDSGLDDELLQVIEQPIDLAVVERLGGLRFSESRRQLLLQTVETTVPADLRSVIAHEATFRELAAMFTALPAGAAGAWDVTLFEALIQRQTKLRGDDGARARAVAFAQA